MCRARCVLVIRPYLNNLHDNTSKNWHKYVLHSYELHSLILQVTDMLWFISHSFVNSPQQEPLDSQINTKHYFYCFVISPHKIIPSNDVHNLHKQNKGP